MLKCGQELVIKQKGTHKMDPNQTPAQPPVQPTTPTDPYAPPTAQVITPTYADTPTVTPAEPNAQFASAEPVAQPAQPTSFVQPSPEVQPSSVANDPFAVPVAQPAFMQEPQQQPMQPMDSAATATVDENPEKSYLVALLLSYFLGSLGVDRFYLKKTGTGIAKLLTFGGLGIWQLIDMLLIAFGKLKAKGDDRPLEGFAHNFSWVKLVSIILIIFNVVVIGGILLLITLTTYAGIQEQAKLQQYNAAAAAQTQTYDPSTVDSSSTFQTN